jgi:predicted branched-subunit amino acid permease
MTLMVYAGSAQLAVLPLIVAGAPVWLIFLTALLVNFRFIIFSAVVGPHFSHLHWTRRLWYGYFNADLVMAFFPQRFPQHTLSKPAGKLGYFMGLAMPTWCSWQLGSLIGILLASQIPRDWGIGFAGSLALLAIAIPLVRNRPTIVGVVVACTVAVVTVQWPYRLGLVTAMLLGIVAAVFTEQLMIKPKETV